MALSNLPWLNRGNLFGGEELYPTIVGKSAALGFFLIANHPFVDGNKSVGHAALEVTLVLNGFELKTQVDEQEQIVLAVASGKMAREAFTAHPLFRKSGMIRQSHASRRDRC